MVLLRPGYLSRHRKLVLNYGLRWEIYFPQSVTGKGAGGWVDLGTGLVNVAGFGDINLQGNVKHNFTNFAPRLGIARQRPDEAQS